MSCIMVVDLICPKCGGPVVWCNGGDIISNSKLQVRVMNSKEARCLSEPLCYITNQ